LCGQWFEAIPPVWRGDPPVAAEDPDCSTRRMFNSINFQPLGLKYFHFSYVLFKIITFGGVFKILRKGIIDLK
jgi:hypothetical protein